MMRKSLLLAALLIAASSPVLAQAPTAPPLAEQSSPPAEEPIPEGPAYDADHIRILESLLAIRTKQIAAMRADFSAMAKRAMDAGDAKAKATDDWWRGKQ